MYHSALVCSLSLFETCWNICYWCMNNTAIYNLFAGKRGLSWPWPPGEAVCLHGNYVCFGSLLKAIQAPALLKVRWCLWAAPWPGRALSRASCAQVSPKPGSWGSSRLSHAKSLNHLSYKLGKQTGWKHAILPLGILIPATCLEMDFLPHGLLMSGLLSTGRALGLYSQLACGSLVLFPFVLS